MLIGINASPDSICTTMSSDFIEGKDRLIGLPPGFAS